MRGRLPKGPCQSSIPNQPENAEDIIRRLSAKAAAVEKTQRLLENTNTEIRTTKIGKKNVCCSSSSSLKSKAPFDKDITKATQDDGRNRFFRRPARRNNFLSTQQGAIVVQIHGSYFRVNEPMSLEEIVSCLHFAISKTDFEDSRCEYMKSISAYETS